jgi:hypothetical protein
LGVVSLQYPAHLATLGRMGGIASILWGVLFFLLSRQGKEPNA